MKGQPGPGVPRSRPFDVGLGARPIASDAELHVELVQFGFELGQLGFGLADLDPGSVSFVRRVPRATRSEAVAVDLLGDGFAFVPDGDRLIPEDPDLIVDLLVYGLFESRQRLHLLRCLGQLGFGHLHLIREARPDPIRPGVGVQGF